jgi:hypothetical protein
MQSRTSILSAFTLSTSMAFGVAAIAAELPKEGTDTHANTWVVPSSDTIKLGDRSYTTFELAGVSRNESGGTMFNNMVLRCLGAYEVIGSEAQYSSADCTYTDKDGDQIFERVLTTCPCKANEGEATLVGGSGKFAGISGKEEYSAVYLLTPDDKRLRGIVTHHDVHWKIQ